jgi:DNA polymerase-3 subunit epsilon
VVEELVHGLTRAPALLLDPLVERMHRLANQQRYEEAAWARDRHEALARALGQAREWRALTGAGWLVLEDRDGTTIVIDHGSLVETRPPGSLPRIHHLSEEAPATPVVAPSVEVAEETSILWRWIEANQARLVECTGSFAYPVQRVERLSSLRVAA